MFDRLRRRKPSNSVVPSVPETGSGAPAPVTQLVQTAFAYHQSGRYDEAEKIYREVLAAEPNQFDALHLLGVLAHQTGRSQEAAYLLGKALLIDSSDVSALCNVAEIYRVLGRFGDGRSCCDQAIRLKPDHAAGYLNKGLLCEAQGEVDDARICYETAISLAPSEWRAYSALGALSIRAGDRKRARECYESALSIRPAQPDVLCALGALLIEKGEPTNAVGRLQEALAINSELAEGHFHLGNAFVALGRLVEASASYRRAIEVRPGFADAYVNLANLHKDAGAIDLARELYETALTIDANHVDAHFNYGELLRQEHRLEEALAHCQRAVELAPNLAYVHNGLGHVLADQDQHQEALACFCRVLEIDPTFVDARWAYAMTQLPWIYEAAGDMPLCRSALKLAISELEQWFGGNLPTTGFNAVGVRQPFLLAYQEQENREPLMKYGELCARLMQQWQTREGLRPASHRGNGRPRVGIVSAHICNHSVWKAILKGWFQWLDTERVELLAFHLSPKVDAETAFAESHARHFEFGARSLKQWADTILSHEPDVLIYPEIGMDPMTVKLASLRLAPVQAASWGHPETTGLPTIDYYLSAEDFEPEGAQQYYSEELVILPHLGCAYEPRIAEAAEPDWSNLGVAPDRPIFVCPGSAFKYTPPYDAVLVAIARRLPSCQFLFFISPHGAERTHKLRMRVSNSFRVAGLDPARHLIFAPWLSTPYFYGLLRRSHVVLDTIGFSGFNTAIQAAEQGLPIVTREGRFMRGRFASGILRRMGLGDLVAQTEEQYIDLAVRLVSDERLLEQTRERMIASRDVLFNDQIPVHALEQFVTDVVRR